MLAPGQAPNYAREMYELILVILIRPPCFPFDWAVDSVAAVAADTNISAYANPRSIESITIKQGDSNND
jgi:hypothetical protein